MLRHALSQRAAPAPPPRPTATQLFIKVDKKLSVNDTMNAMRTHFEGTWFDNRGLVRGPRPLAPAPLALGPAQVRSLVP